MLVILLIPLSLLSLTVNIRSFDHQGYTRLVFEGDRGFEFKVDSSRNGLAIKLKEKAELEKTVTTFKRSELVDHVVHRVEKDKSVLDVRLKSGFTVKRQFVLEAPFRVVFDLVKIDEGTQSPETQPQSQTPEPETTPPEPQPPTAPAPQEQDPELQDDPPPAGEEPVAPPRQKKRSTIDIICIDPGHGGSDLGAVGPSKTAEKDITLKISKKLKRRIESRLGLRVVTTRDNDSEVSLNSRVSIANNQKAQLFISIHVNSSFRKAARGSETFYVSLKATDQEALRLSQQENKSFEEFETITEDDELKMILWDMAQNEYIKESSRLAEFIQDELNILLHTRNRGVKQAPFRVLMRAAMPAVLVEVVFISNPYEEQKLQDDGFLENVADAIYKGISKYIYYHNNTYR